MQLVTARGCRDNFASIDACGVFASHEVMRSQDHTVVDGAMNQMAMVDLMDRAEIAIINIALMRHCPAAGDGDSLCPALP